MEFYFPNENITIEADSIEKALKLLKAKQRAENILNDNN
jgi:hypothetical protein